MPARPKKKPAPHARSKPRRSRKPADGRAAKKNKPGCPALALRLVVAALALALAVPAAHVTAVKFIDPAFTPMMAQRWLGAKLAGREPAPIRHEWMPIADVPPKFLRMVLSVEDARFFQHDGFDRVELEAAWRHFRDEGGPLRGASTVSMQCARTVFLWQDRTPLRKILEAWTTILAERILGKRRILELHVNHAEMGDGIYGLAAASHAHFGLPPRQLSDRQLATLAALLPAPLAWDPNNPSPKLERRIQRVLARHPALHLPANWGQATYYD